MYAFFKRLKEIEDTEKKRLSKAANPDNSHWPNTSKESLEGFRLWLLEELIDRGLAKARRPPVVQAILSLTLLGIYLEVFGREVEIQEAVFSGQRVEALLACQASEFSEARSRARMM